MKTRDIKPLMYELYVIQAYLLQCAPMLEELRASIQFLLDARNPAMDKFPEDIKNRDRQVFKKEARILLLEVQRLNMSRAQQEKRLGNLTHFVSLARSKFLTVLRNHVRSTTLSL
jgi:hypothetical protein